MKTFSLLISMMCTLVFSQQEIRLFGPRAGIGYIPNGGSTDLDGGVHSAFGWMVEIPYRSKAFTGYGEGGFLLLGTEQGTIFPEAWGFFGVRTDLLGFGVGPVVNPMGVGIAFGPYVQYTTENVRVPFGINFAFIDGTFKGMFLMGFSLL